MKCKYCNSDNLIEKITENGPHYAELRCINCGQFLQWIPKPKNEKEEIRRNNVKWRKMWRELGPLTCRWCGIKETETNMGFEIDHVFSIEDGGQDVFENTQPLCSACHWTRNAERHREENLVPLCAKHHRVVEHWSWKIFEVVGDWEIVRYMLRQKFDSILAVIAWKLKQLKSAS